jgi:hypothetical protein
MSLLDLQNRTDDPEVTRLRGSEATRAPEVLVGWQEHGELVAIAQLMRRNAQEIELVELTTDPKTDREEIGLVFLDAIADVASAVRLTVFSADADVGWLMGRGGFVAPPTEEEGRDKFLVRGLGAQSADPGMVAALTLGELEQLIVQSWGPDTAALPTLWSEDNPARGQCDVTALLVRELFGGDILCSNVLRGGMRVERHAWNRLPSGVCIDLTRGQFKEGETFEEPTVQEPHELGGLAERHAILAARLRIAVAGQSSDE